jgi:UV DNA damage endonuclease
MVSMVSGVPIVFDFHHHSIHPDGLTEHQALALACQTWQVRPCTHYSESRQIEDPSCRLERAHSRLIYSEIKDYGLDFDCVVEAKGKELAVLKHREDHQNAAEIIAGEDKSVA